MASLRGRRGRPPRQARKAPLGRYGPTSLAIPSRSSLPPGHRRFPLIDAIRGLAVLYIVVAHGVVFGGGAGDNDWYRGLFAHNIGIAMFFVVSGFVIYRPFVAHRVLGAPHPGIVAYVRRRFLRIVPPYWLALTVLSIYPGLGGVFTEDWWVYYGLLQLYPIYDPGECAQTVEGCGIAPAITLPGELGFYVILPIYVAFIAALTKGGFRRRWLRTELLLLGGLALVSIVFRTWSAVHEPPLPYVFYGMPCTFLWVALGIGMAAASVALVSYYAFERPILRFKDHRRRSPRRA